jgi:NADH-quinone oxidoreductase subunit G
MAAAARAALALGAVKDGWNGFSVLHTAAARVGGLDIGFVPGEGAMTAADMAVHGALDVLFLLGADELQVSPGAFTVYIGTHGDRGAHRADVILPGAAYTEKSGLYVNTEGRVQMAARAAFPPGDAREDWAILRALSDVLGHKLPYDSLASLRAALFAAHPHLARIDAIAAGDPADLDKLARLAGTADRAPLRSPVDDFYLTNPIARASAVMAECSAIAEGATALTAAE